MELHLGLQFFERPPTLRSRRASWGAGHNDVVMKSVNLLLMAGLAALVAYEKLGRWGETIGDGQGPLGRPQLRSWTSPQLNRELALNLSATCRAHEGTCQHDICLEYIASIWPPRRLRMDDGWRA